MYQYWISHDSFSDKIIIDERNNKTKGEGEMQMTPMYLIITIFIVVATIWIFINTIITKKWRNRAPGETESWKFGVFYYNPGDKRIFLPKRTGLGITFNFAQPLAIVLSLIFIFGVIFVVILVG